MSFIKKKYLKTRKVKKIKVNVKIDNEYGKLKTVVVSSAEYYDPATNNETIKYYAENGGISTKDVILEE